MRILQPGRGFTLVEMMVVILVIGISLAVVAPSLPGPPEGDDAAARRLVRVLDGARREAAARGVNVRVDVELPSGTYRVTSDPPTGGEGPVLASGVLGEVRAAPGPNTRLRVRFDALGRAKGGAVRLGVTKHAPIVLIDPWTGRVRVEPG